MKNRECYETHQNCNGSECERETVKATPGPWAFEIGTNGRDAAIYHQPDETRPMAGKRICTVNAAQTSLVDCANARMIAACPDLFEACKLAFAEHSSGRVNLPLSVAGKLFNAITRAAKGATL